MIRWLVDHATTVLILVVCLFVGGMYSYVVLPREASPDIQIPVVLVTTAYTGVSPQDVESLVTIPLENELTSLTDVKEMTSTSAEGVSVVAIEFEPDVDIEDALQKVRDRVSTAQPDLPEDAEDPEIREIAFSDIPILIVTIAGPLDENVLKRIGEDLEEDVARIPGVLEAKLSGGLEREIRVQVDPLRLAHYGLSLGDVVGAIGDENVNVPGGTVRTGAGNVLLRVPGEFTEPREVEEVAIKRVGDRPVFVRDVARVVDGWEERATYARMNGQTAVSLSVTKRPGSNIIEIADAVKAEVAEASKGWPDGATYRVLADESSYIRDMVRELQNNILTALILVVGIIFLFMGARNSLLVALAIPLSMWMSFLALYLLGFTLNMMVLFSLILALGMLVDNAIVVVENIYRHAEEGKDKRRAAIDGTGEVAMAIAASTLTTVAAFFPLVFWGGIMGEFMGFLPKTVIIVLVSSLVVAVVVLPATMSRFMRPLHAVGRGLSEEEEERELSRGRVMSAYRAVLELSIRFRYLSLVGIGALLVGTVAIFALFSHGTEFFPETDPDRVTVRVVAPEGTDLETTDAILRRVDAILAQEENVDVFVSEVGVSATGDALSGSQAAPSQGKITVDFLPDRNAAERGERIRSEPTPVTVARLREAVKDIPGVRISIEAQEMGPPVGDPIVVQVAGDDYHEVGRFAEQLRRQIATIEGTTDLRDDYQVGRPELRLRIDRGSAKRVGVSTGEVGNVVRTAVAGTKASALRDGEDEYDIVVRVAPEFRDDLPSILDLRVPGRIDTSPDTFPVPLSAVASYDLAGGTSAIHHVDQDLVVTITGDVLEGHNENAVRAEVQSLLDRTDTGTFHASMAGADEEQQEAGAFLMRAFVIALGLILLVLVAQFDSLTLPLIVLASVVLSTIGVLWGLLLTGTAFGIIMTGIGVISLAGVVVNNAIVLLDYVEQLRARGLDMHAALVRAGITRFRPVLLTAVTTILGLVPMAIGVSIDFTQGKVLVGGSSAQFWGPMAVAVTFGLAFATVLTLVMVPTFYSIREDVVTLWARVRGVRMVEAAAKLLPLALVVVAGRAEAVSLEEAVRAAEENNLDLAVQREQTVQAETLRGQAWALIQPRLSAQAGYTLNEYAVVLDPAALAPPGLEDAVEGEPIVVQEKDFWTGSATIAQPLFSGNALPLLRGAYQLTEAARLEETWARSRIRLGVARAYYGLAVAREAIVLSEESLETARSQLELAERQVAAGMAPRRTVLQAQLAISRAEREVAAARERAVAAEEAFTRATGLPRDAEVTMPAPPAVPADLEGAVSEAVATRPDVLATFARARAARFERDARWLGWLPELDATFTWSYSQNTGFADDPTQWIAGVQGTWILWDGGLRAAQARQLASQARAAGYLLEKQREIAEEQVRTAWERFRRAEAALAAVQREEALAEENLELARRAFTAGSATWLEVEEAELGLRGARMGALTERMERDLAAYELEIALGRTPL